MAIEYSLVMQTTATVEQVRTYLCRSLGVDAASSQLVAPGLLIRVMEVSRLQQKILLESLDIRSTVDVSFHIDKFEGYEAGVEGMLRYSLALIQSLARDVALIFNGETVILLERAGTLLLNRDGFWRDERLALVCFPYRLAELPPVG